MTPTLSAAGRQLYVCNRFGSDISVIDVKTRKELDRIPVQREPVAAALTRDGKYLLVANHLHAGRADVEHVAAVVSLIDTEKRRVIKEIQLPNGSGALNDIKLSPDGKYAAVTHIVANFNRATTQVQMGWLNANALSLIDVAKFELWHTVLLDSPGAGAANPWGIAWSADGRTLAVAHAGTHEVSVINFPALCAALADLDSTAPHRGTSQRVLAFVSSYEGLPAGLPFLVGARQRIKLPPSDRGPRAVTIIGHIVYTTNYFSDTVSAIDLSPPKPVAVSIPLGPKRQPDIVHKGEEYFNDATLCFQGWHSCASCHPGDARSDGLNWDLLNDGLGNPKNTKSLLFAHRTPPAMSLGVRDTAETAVRAGLRHILFTNATEEVACAIDAYLESLKPMPSPHLIRGELSPSARRGESIFSKAGCLQCHPPPLYTDLHSYDVGTRAGFDKPSDKFDTPSLIELWRTALYLHDGSAATVTEILTSRNRQDQHGKTSVLTPAEISDLSAYLLSL